MKPGMVCLSVTCPTFLHLYHDPFPSTDSQNHLLCPSLESRFTSHAFVLRVDASCDSWELGPALWAVLYGWHNDFPSLCSSLERTSNHWKEERDEAIEWSVWRILLILSANHSTMESLAGSLVIITALKTHTFTIVLTRISQLLAHNFSHIKLCEDVYIYILVRPHVSIGRSYNNTCCANQLTPSPIPGVPFETVGSCLIWYIPYDGLPRRWKNKKNRKRKSAKRDTRSLHAPHNVYIVYRVSCTIGVSASLSRGWVIFTRIRQINICWQECTVNGDLPDLLGLKVRSNCVRAAAYLKYITLIYFTNEI